MGNGFQYGWRAFSEAPPHHSHRWHRHSPAYVVPKEQDPVAQWTCRQLLPVNMTARQVADTFYNSMRADDMDTWLATLAVGNRAWPGGRVNDTVSGPFYGNLWYLGRNKARKYDVRYTYKRGAPASEEEEQPAPAPAPAEPEAETTATDGAPPAEGDAPPAPAPVVVPPNREVPENEDTVTLTYDAHFGPDVPGYKGLQIGARGKEWRKGPDPNIQGEPTVTITLRKEYGQWRVLEAMF